MRKWIFALLLVPSLAFGFGDLIDESQNQGQLQGQAQGQGQHQGLHNDQKLSAGAKAKSGSQSAAESNAEARTGDSSATLRQVEGDSFTLVETEYETVSAGAASLNLSYCGEGASGQIEEGGFAVANVNFICESVASLKVYLLFVEMELARAAKYEEQGKYEMQEIHLVQANLYMEEAKELIDNVHGYIDGRYATAGLGAAARDIAVPAVLFWLIFLL